MTINGIEPSRRVSSLLKGLLSKGFLNKRPLNKGLFRGLLLKGLLFKEPLLKSPLSKDETRRDGSIPFIVILSLNHYSFCETMSHVLLSWTPLVEF